MDSFVTFICPISNESQFRVLANEFEAFHGIPQIIVVINGLYIPIFAPTIGGEDYYCEKEIIEFCCKVSLTQNVCFGIVNLDKHEASMIGFFSNSQNQERLNTKEVIAYKLIKDCAYMV